MGLIHEVSSFIVDPLNTGWQPFHSKSNVLLMPALRMPYYVGELAPTRLLKPLERDCSALEGVTGAEIH